MAALNTLIVEDHADSARALRKLLGGHGIDARVARTVAEAERSLTSGWPRSVVLDLCLPDGSGIDLLRTIRLRGPAVRVAVATGSADDAMLREVKRLRADAIFVKPLWPPSLLAWLGCAAE